MAKKYLDYDGLLYFWQKIKAIFVSDVTYNSTSRKIQKTKSGTTSDVVTLAEVATSGSYTNLSNKPTIPSAGTGSNYPMMDGTRTLGSQAGFARVDHVHPTDTSRAPLESPAFTGTPTAPTASTGTSTTQIATTEFVANTVGAMTSGVSDVQVDNTSVVTSGIAHIDTFGVNGSATPGTKGLVPAPPAAGSPSYTHSSIFSDGVWRLLLLESSQPTSGPANGTVQISLKAKNTSDASTTVTLKTITIPAASSTNDGSMSSTHYTKLEGIASGAEVNQNAFSNIKVGSTTVAADAKTDTLELVAGTDIKLTPDATNDKVTIAFDGTIPSRASEIDFQWDADQEIGTQPQTVADALNDIDSWAFTVGQALSNKIEISTKGAANGVCPLNASSKIDSTYLPSYVDDVIEAYPRSGQTELSSTWLATSSASGTVITPEAGKIYVLMADSTNYSANSQFRWGGSAYVKMNDGGVSSITNAEINTIVAA